MAVKKENDNVKVRDFGLVFYLWFLTVLGAYAYGGFSIYRLYVDIKTTLSEYITDSIFELNISLSQTEVTLIATIVGVLFLIGLIVAIIQVWFMSYFGAEIVSTIIFGGSLAILGAGIYVLLMVDQFWVGLAIIILAVFVLAIVLMLARRIILGARIFEMSCEAVNAKKATLLPVIITAIMSVVTMVFALFASVYASYTLDSYIETLWLRYAVFFGIIYLYLVIYWTMIYFGDAINICMFKRWNNYKDASLRIAMKEVWKVKGSIVLFGMFMAFFDWIMKIVHYFSHKQIRKTSKFYQVWNVMQKVLTVVFFIFVIILRWLYRIIKFLNYYTLTLIVVEKQGFIKSIARSVDLSVTTGADIIIGRIGVGIAKGLFTFITFLTFAVGGFYVGYFWISPEFGITGSVTKLSFSIVAGLVFFLFGYLPMTAIMRTVSTAYKTILFFYVADPFRGKAGRRCRVTDSIAIANGLKRVQDDLMKDYKPEERTTWEKDKKAIATNTAQ